MTQNAHVPARQPVSDILREAARLGLELQPGTLPPNARFLYAAIGETLDPRQQAEGPLGYRNALDNATVTLCAERGAEHAGERLVPTTVHRAEHLITHCSALYDAPRSYVAGAFSRLGTSRSGGIPAPALKDLANSPGDDRIRRVCGDGADYPALAGPHDLAPGASAKSSIPAEPQAVTELPPNSEKAITLPALNVHATLTGC